MKYLLDTNICIYIIKQKPDAVRRHFEQHTVGEIGVSSITAAELSYGVEKSQRVAENRRALEQFLMPLTIANFDHRAAQSYGKIRADLERRGQPSGPLDLLIGAHALSIEVILVTNNEGEFSRIGGLVVENWVQ